MRLRMYRIPERKDVDPRLHRSEEQLRLILDSIKDYAIFMVDQAGFVASWNPGAEAIKGYTPEEIIGKHISTFYTPEDQLRGRPQRLLESAAREGRVEDEGWRVRKDGTRFWADVVISRIEGEPGELIGFSKVTRDLTEKRQAELAREASEERLRLMIDCVEDYAIFMLDPQGIVLSWNPGAHRLKGYTREEIIGCHFRRFYSPEDINLGKPELELQIAAEQGRYEEEGWRIRKDGTRFWANLIISAMRDSHGKLLGFTKITRDMTDRLRAEEISRELVREQAARAAAQAAEERIRKVAEENARLYAEAHAAVRLRDDFLSIAGHELKTPLTALGLQLQSLAAAFANQTIANNLDRWAERVGKTLSHVGRLDRLINDLLDVSRLTTARVVLDCECFDLVQLVREVIELHAEEAHRSGSPISIIEHGPIEGIWDRGRIDQVLTNLLSNAIKYGAGQAISVTVEKIEGYAQISVHDDGIGIDPADRSRIFGRFERAVSPRHYGGFGLGLWIVKEIVEAHGGTVGFDSAPGRGTTFFIRLPLESGAGRE